MDESVSFIQYFLGDLIGDHNPPRILECKKDGVLSGYGNQRAYLAKHGKWVANGTDLDQNLSKISDSLPLS